MQNQGHAHHLVVPRTLVFLRRGGLWLFLEGGPSKWFAGKLNGLGGGVEPGEDVRTAALREVEEETGLAPIGFELRGTVHVTADPAVMLFVFSGELPEGDLRPNGEGELCWLPASALDDPQRPFLADVRMLLGRVVDGALFHLRSEPA